MSCAADVVSSLQNKLYFLMFAHCLKAAGKLARTESYAMPEYFFFSCWGFQLVKLTGDKQTIMLQATGQHATYVHRECIQVLCLCGRTTG